MNTAPLREIGFTESETRVYLALLEFGTTTAGNVVEKSGLQNAVVHRAFHSLNNKGAITHTKIGKIREYQAIEPNRLLDIVDSKKENLKSIIPELEILTKTAKTKPTSRTYEGIRGIRELWNLISMSGKELLSYGAPEKAHFLLGDHFWKAHHRILQEEGVYSRHVFNQSFKWRGKQIPSESAAEIRYTEKTFDSITETVICGNKVAIIIYLNKPIGFLIDEPSVAKSYKRFFEDIWKRAKK